MYARPEREAASFLPNVLDEETQELVLHPPPYICGEFDTQTTQCTQCKICLNSSVIPGQFGQSLQMTADELYKVVFCLGLHVISPSCRADCLETCRQAPSII